jgi:hypothetical protein
MIHLQDIRYVRLGTRELDAAERYATSILGLQVAESMEGMRYFRSDSRNHTLVCRIHRRCPCAFTTGRHHHLLAYRLAHDRRETRRSVLDARLPSTGVRSITDEATDQPRQFPFAPSSFCMWGSTPDIPEFKT